MRFVKCVRQFIIILLTQDLFERDLTACDLLKGKQFTRRSRKYYKKRLLDLLQVHADHQSSRFQNKNAPKHFCVDYRHWNSIARKDVYLTPRADDASNSRQGASYISLPSLRSGCSQIPTAEEDHEKSTFFTPDSLVEFNVMPLGHANASATS